MLKTISKEGDNRITPFTFSSPAIALNSPGTPVFSAITYNTLSLREQLVSLLTQGKTGTVVRVVAVVIFFPITISFFLLSKLIDKGLLPFAIRLPLSLNEQIERAKKSLKVAVEKCETLYSSIEFAELQVAEIQNTSNWDANAMLLAIKTKQYEEIANRLQTYRTLLPTERSLQQAGLIETAEQLLGLKILLTQSQEKYHALEKTNNNPTNTAQFAQWHQELISLQQTLDRSSVSPQMRNKLAIKATTELQQEIVKLQAQGDAIKIGSAIRQRLYSDQDFTDPVIKTLLIAFLQRDMVTIARKYEQVLKIVDQACAEEKVWLNYAIGLHKLHQAMQKKHTLYHAILSLPTMVEDFRLKQEEDINKLSESLNTVKQEFFTPAIFTDIDTQQHILATAIQTYHKIFNEAGMVTEPIIKNPLDRLAIYAVNEEYRLQTVSSKKLPYGDMYNNQLIIEQQNAWLAVWRKDFNLLQINVDAFKRRLNILRFFGTTRSLPPLLSHAQMLLTFNTLLEENEKFCAELTGQQIASKKLRELQHQVATLRKLMVPQAGPLFSATDVNILSESGQQITHNVMKMYSDLEGQLVWANQINVTRLYAGDLIAQEATKDLICSFKKSSLITLKENMQKFKQTRPSGVLSKIDSSINLITHFLIQLHKVLEEQEETYRLLETYCDQENVSLRAFKAGLDICREILPPTLIAPAA